MGVLPLLYIFLPIDYNLTMERYDRKNLSFARENRKARHATRQEGLLWHLYLKKSDTNFSRQYRMDKYILDFYAPSICLAIEIDGGQHFEDVTIAYDSARTALLQAKGVTVLRFTNDDVDKNLNGVMLAIEKEIERLKRASEGDLEG